jgi:serine/threonine-protein kinase RsbW
VVLIRFPSELGYEKVAMASAATVAARMGFPPARIEDVKTAVAEACTNAIEHGNELDGSVPVLVELSERSTCLEVVVSDAGRKRIPSCLPHPRLGLQQRGLGIFLIKNLVDEFDFGTTAQGGNYLRMCLNLATH